MSYTVLARRYRSRDFDELVGQEPIARTLENAVRSGRSAHAYLFCGTRGVGKTSMARILAKALNVTGELEQSEAIGEAILRGDDLDVIEIDGASNRGIQEAKDLIAGAGLSPARCRYKIYIIDEVHMLTREAFNALLKTMEEPPAHVKFILCTTEAHKVPATIQSRCQRFDFRPLPASRIAEQLRMILEREGIEADEEVVASVARLGNGSMRDALSLLDRLLASGEPRLTVELLEQMLGVPDQALVTSLVSAVTDGDAAAALARGEELLRGGTSVEQAFELLTEHFRSLLVISACGSDTELVELSGDARELAATQAAHFDPPGLVHMIALCDAAARNGRGSSTARAIFDAALVRLCMSHHLADVADLLTGTPTQTPGATKSTPAKKKEQAAGQLTAPSPEPPARDDRVAAPGPASRPPSARATAPSVSVAADEALWPTVLTFASRSQVDQLIVEGVRFLDFDGHTLRLSVDERGADYARFITSRLDRIVDLVLRATKRRVHVEIDAVAAADRTPTSTAADLNEVRSLPAVRQAVELFDATIVDVQEIEPESQDETTDV
ncbi:MAG: DNA polymerase III subunit gamma/tau [Planctomycetota bacterium]